MISNGVLSPRKGFCLYFMMLQIGAMLQPFDTAWSVTFFLLSCNILYGLIQKEGRFNAVSMLYFGWIAAAFLTGIVIMLRTGHRSTLRQRIEAVGAFRGMYYDEVMERLERAPNRTVERADG